MKRQDRLRGRGLRTSGERASRLEQLESRRLLAAGGLDTSFGSAGKVLTDFPGTSGDAVAKAVLQSTGKIVVLTEGTPAPNRANSVRLARYTADGQLDQTFGSGGSVVLAYDASAVAVRADDRIIVAGQTTFDSGSGPVDGLLVARYTADGKVDGSFGGGDGQVVQPLFGGESSLGGAGISKVLVRPDNRILVAGTADTFDGSDRRDFGLESLTEAGDLDPQFGVQFPGVTLTDFGSDDDFLNDAALTPSGGIVAAGLLLFSDSHHPFAREDFAVASYDEHGQEQWRATPSFGNYPDTNNPFAEPPYDSFDAGQSVAVDAAGNVFVAGYTEDPTDFDPFLAAVVKLKSTGVVDPTFGPGGTDGDGKVEFDFGAMGTPVGQHPIAVLPTGKILLAAGVDGASGRDFALTRLNADGSIDTTFGSGGRITTDFGADDAPTALLLQGAKAIVAGGSVLPTTNPGPAPSRLAMARYTLDATTPPPPAQTPFGGTALNVSGVLQFENFDNGGEGISWHDTEGANLGGAYRNTAVDVQAIPSPRGGNTLAFTKAGEWVEYTINATQAGRYALALDYASLRGGGRFHLEVDGKAVTGSISLASTQDWQRYVTKSLGAIDLTQGQHVLRVAMDANDSTGYVANFDRMTFQLQAGGGGGGGVRTPFKGTPFVPNQQIEAEDYDLGGEGVAYHDLDAKNVTGAYRPTEGVDVEAAGDSGGGFDVGYAKAGEYLTYSLNAPQAGVFGVQVRLASLRAGGRFHVEIDGKNVASFSVPATGSWQTYVTLSSAKNVSLSAGDHTLKLVMDQNNAIGYVANFNWLKVVS